MNICGKTNITYTQAMNFAKSKNAHTTFVNNAKIYWDLCTKVGINPCVAYCQYALETGWGKFGGVLNASYCNPCGLKIPAGGSCTDPNAHKKFSSWEKGIAAHIDHLALYAGVSGYPKSNTEDPRHFKYLFGTVKTVEGLTGKWAMSSTYANNLINLVNALEKYTGCSSEIYSSNTTPTKNNNGNNVSKPVENNSDYLSGTNFKVRITTASLNIRKSNSFDSNIVGTVKKGQVFTIISVSNGLGRLKSGVGYISMHKNYVEKVTTINNTTTLTGYKVRVVNCTYVNARRGPSTSSKIGSVVKAGTILSAVSETRDGWVKLQSGLYIYKNYLKKL